VLASALIFVAVLHHLFQRGSSPSAAQRRQQLREQLIQLLLPSARRKSANVW